MHPPNPWAAALATFSAFLLAGTAPLLPLFWNLQGSAFESFDQAAILTGLTFLVVGYWQGRIVHFRPWLSAVQSLAMGAAAAIAAYGTAYYVEQMVSP